MTDSFSIVVLLSALGCGLTAGVFFAFSSFVMTALARLPSVQGIAAMQAINVAVINPLFLAVFLGTALACLAVLICTLVLRPTPGAPYAILGSALYLIGTFLVTIACNVPRNNALAAVEPASSGSAEVWVDFLKGWTFWNHVRTVAALAAAASLILAH